MDRMNRKNVLSNLVWRLAEKFGAKVVSLIVSIVLARLLMPEEYGVISLITVFTSILSLFTDCGFSDALIQKKNADQLDFSTVFYFNVFMGLALYGIMFVSAPAIAQFYHRDYLVSYIQVMSLTLVIGSFKSIQDAVVRIRMQQKLFFFATIGGTIVSAVLGIWMAYHGMGVWALICQQLSNQLIDTIILWLMVRWRPTKEFSITRLKPLFQYGSKLLLSALLDRVTMKISSLIIGKVHSAEELAYYEKGSTLPSIPMENLADSVDSVMLPVMSQKQDNKQDIQNTMRRFLKFSCYGVFPAMVGMCICSESIIRLLYTEKWIMMTPYMQLSCISFLPWMIHIVNLMLLKSLGKSGYFLRLEIIKQTLGIVYLIAVVPFGVLPLMVANTIFNFICIFINGYYSKRLIEYGILEQLRDLIPIALLTAVMGSVVYGVGFLPYGTLLTLALQVLTGVVVYIVGSLVLHLDIFYYILNTAKEVLHK